MERRVHKIVVCKHSKWFAKACTGDFKVGAYTILSKSDVTDRASGREVQDN